MKKAKQTERRRRLKKGLSAVLSALLLTVPQTVGAADVIWAEETVPFSDVTPGDWFYEDVLTAYAMGLVNGKSAAVYAPYEGFRRPSSWPRACISAARKAR